MVRAIYIGEFPPPFGGVTVKNDLLKEKVYNDKSVVFFNLYDCKKNFLKIIYLLRLIKKAKKDNLTILLGVGSNKRLELIIKIIKFIGNDKLINNCVIFMMGSTLQNYCSSRSKYVEILKKVRCIFTESHSIEDEFNKLGINNVDYFPNCRVVEGELRPNKRNMKQPIKLVFFSKICKEKGVQFLFEMSKFLIKDNIQFKLDFFGEIDPNYEVEFKESIDKYTGCRYCGVFDAVNDDVYKKLHEYNILVFPSIWKGEGVPGILVESKIAGIPAIVSDHNYNSEVIQDYIEGIVVGDNLEVGFYKAVEKLYYDDKILYNLAEGAFESRKRYNILEYKSKLLESIE